MTFTSCGQAATAYTCKGKATVKGLGRRDATVALKAQISKAVSVGHSWTVVFTPTGG